MTPTPRAWDLLRRVGSIDCFPFTRPSAQTRFTFNGTVAINQVIQDLALAAGDRVLMPAYFCGSELGPFEHRGCVLDFYNVGPDLQIDLDSLRATLTPDTKAVFITHYFGFPQRDAAAIAELCRAQGAVLIEDCAHALFSDDAKGPVGRHGNYAVFSPRKSLPLVDGGVLTARSPFANAEQWLSVRPPIVPAWDRLVYGIQQSARSGLGHGGALWRRVTILALMPFSILIKIMRKVAPLNESDWATADVEGDAAVPFYETRISSFGLRGLNTADAEFVKATRRENYALWLSAVSEIDGCCPLLPSLSPGVCPLYFPLLADDPAGLVQFLEHHGIEAFLWWPHRHPSINWGDFPHLDTLKDRVIALPVHQQLGEATIARIAALIQNYSGCRRTGMNIDIHRKNIDIHR